MVMFPYILLSEEGCTVTVKTCQETYEHHPSTLAENEKKNNLEPKAPAQQAWKSAVIVKLL